MQWLKENTPEDAVIASWWDYGYWISTLAERKTLADNSTLLDWQIRKIAATYMSTPEDAWQILTSDTDTDVSSYYVTLPTDVTNPTQPTSDIYDEKEHKLDAFKEWIDASESKFDSHIKGNVNNPKISDKYPTVFDYWESEVYITPPVMTGLDADYIIINLAAQKLSSENIMDLYVLNQKGGDETKAFWFFKIAELPVFDYYGPELTTYTDKFWDETLLGKLIPFTQILYVNTDNPELQSETFKPGYTAIYVQNIKFPTNGDGPFQLVYVPPSFAMDVPGPMTGPLIYKVNKEYNPNQ